MSPGTAATRAVATPARFKWPPVVHHEEALAHQPAVSKATAPVRNANGNGMSIGWRGCPNTTALLLILPPPTGLLPNPTQRSERFAFQTRAAVNGASRPTA